MRALALGCGPFTAQVPLYDAAPKRAAPANNVPPERRATPLRRAYHRRMQPPEIVSLGEALVDLIGDPQRGYRAIPGGSPLNAAVAAARLGGRCALLTRLSRDPFGDLLRAHLESAGVDLSFAQIGDEPTGLALVTLDAAGAARYAFYRSGVADVLFDPQPRPELPPSVRVGNLTLSLLGSPAREAYWDLLARTGRAGRRSTGAIAWVLDPNARPALWPEPERFAAELDRWLEHVDLLKLSDEDLRFLGGDLVQLLQRAFAAGVHGVVVTAGADGATLHRAEAPPLSVPGRAVAVVDSVGAGDTFTAGLTTGLLQAGDPRQLSEAQWRALLQRANAAAALSCTRAGANPPSAAELLEAR